MKCRMESKKEKNQDQCRMWEISLVKRAKMKLIAEMNLFFKLFAIY